MAGPVSAEEDDRSLAPQRKLLENAKKIALLVAGAASQKYMQQIADHQEVMGAIADIAIEVYAMDSVLARTLKLIESRGEAASAVAIAMCNVYLQGAFARVECSAKKALADVAEGDTLRARMTILRRLVKADPVNVIAARNTIAASVLEAGRYVL
jgi:butyryl-CoA dehydrogenase